MNTLRIATLTAILGGSLLGATAAAFVVPALLNRFFTEPVAAPMPVAAAAATSGPHADPTPPSSAPADSAPAPSASTSSSPQTPPLELEGPLPPWLETPLPADPSEVDAAAIRCARGNAIDCMRAGDAYEAGRGVPPEPRQARLNRSAGARLLEVACRRREAEACYSLSVAYTLGQGVIASPDSARAYLERARELCQATPAPICDRMRQPGAE